MRPTVSTHTPTLKRGYESQRDLRKVAVNQDIGTRMVMEAQIESGTFASQSVGGPLKVTSMLAAVVAKKPIQRPQHDTAQERG